MWRASGQAMSLLDSRKTAAGPSDEVGGAVGGFAGGRVDGTWAPSWGLSAPLVCRMRRLCRGEGLVVQPSSEARCRTCSFPPPGRRLREAIARLRKNKISIAQTIAAAYTSASEWRLPPKESPRNHDLPSVSIILATKPSF